VAQWRPTGAREQRVDLVTAQLAALVLLAASAQTGARSADRLRAPPTGALPYLQQDGHACGGSYMSSGSYCVPKSPQSAPTVYKPANAQCPAGWFSSGAYACEKF
jgi:hypothetical protein